ncbi:hypoxanthine phosphoribosyltransferase [Moritella sp.]|uniref:hypoxanthine phosphoribosyltransferase n=1 Tax=Moritella sp. TaxID=78556 RepID=UPI001D6EF695|nr:hypoxanthine phosphoribosyltransferase [Moritella sp.]MCJ8347930.1 hypoxanthine phosphoribosyltransferase [Moritella sp.]NQZ40396.1 hypoxanthine phosphoribosyltransferase [Moritella sp.]NQZ50479.1 hypoxanthine phosphoribosyltransferase [Moritella sp.]
MKHTVEVMITEADVQAKVKELATQIETHYKDTETLIIVCLLRGSVIYMSDLCRHINLPVELDFMTVSSYGNSMESNRDVRILKDLDSDIKGKDVLIVEDIIDTGFTLSKIKTMLELRDPKSITITTLLDKPSRREVNVPVDWVGFEIPDEFVVGYGIDYGQKYRNLPYVGKVVPLEG